MFNQDHTKAHLEFRNFNDLSMKPSASSSFPSDFSTTFAYKNPKKQVKNDDVELIYVRSHLKKLSEECKVKSIKLKTRANFYRSLNLLIHMLIILGGFVIGLIEAVSDRISYLYIFISFSISILESLYLVLRLGSKGVDFKYASIKFQKMLAIINESLFMTTSLTDLIRIKHQIQCEIDDLNLSLFKSINTDQQSSVLVPTQTNLSFSEHGSQHC